MICIDHFIGRNVVFKDTMQSVQVGGGSKSRESMGGAAIRE